MFLSIDHIGCQCQLFLPEKIFWVWVSLCLVVVMNVKMEHWKLWMLPFYHSLKKMSHTIQIWEDSWLHLQYDLVLEFLGRIISFLPMACMCLIWLNMHLFSWRLVLIMYLYLRAVMKCTRLHFPVIFWLEMASKTCWTVVGSFLPLLKIQKCVLFLSGNAWFHGLLFYDWEMYDMLWCSHYCVTIPMLVPLGGKLTFNSNI